MAAKTKSFSDILNVKLFDIPEVSAAHQIPREGIFMSRLVRMGWNFWTWRLSAGGRFFFIGTMIYLAYGASSLELQAFIPLAYFAAVWILAAFCLPFEKPRVSLAVAHPERVAAGSDIAVQLKLQHTGRGRTGALNVIPHALPLDIRPVPENGVLIRPLAPGEEVTSQLSLVPRRRGIYRLPGFKVQTDYPFGLLMSSVLVTRAASVTVYPRFDPLERLELPMGRKYQPGGVAFAAPRGESTEYIGNREYREGDDVRHIDWRATARLNRPIVREYREEYFLRAAVILDTHVPEPSERACKDFERAVSLCAACGDYMNRVDYLVDILAAGSTLHHLLAGRGLASVDQMLDILACVESSPQKPWEMLLPALTENLEQITSVICLFLDWDEDRRAFASNVAQSGVAVKVIILRDSAPTVDPATNWPGEVPVVGDREWDFGVTRL